MVLRDRMETQRWGSTGCREAATSDWALERQWEDSQRQKKDLPGKGNSLIKAREGRDVCT